MAPFIKHQKNMILCHLPVYIIETEQNKGDNFN